ncbi:MAG TPA: alpha/beta fold hydrolase [Beutenbergiaceae bacterium]|nr:alpha/beta fold hydrolase [Beutenbergiaceae bacterium]
MQIDDSATIWSGLPLADGVPLLVVMHGFGAHEGDLAPLVEHLPPRFAAACIRAPRTIENFPGGYAWFPITANAGMPDMAQADDAVSAVSAWLDSATAGLTPGPIVLLGFSQGGAMVTHLLRHHPTRFAAGVVLSGFLVPGDVAGDEKLASIKPPVFFGYDPMDPIVPGAAFARTREFGEDHFTLSSQAYPVAHGINEDELRDVSEFLAAVLGNDNV